MLFPKTPLLRPLVLSTSLIFIATSPFVMAQAVDDEAWHGSVGMALMSQPKYPGSLETRTGLMPTLSVTKGRWQLGAMPSVGVPLGVGYSLLQEGPWRVGLGIGTSIGNPRNANNNSGQSSLGDIQQTTLGSVSGSYTQGALTASASIIRDIGGHQQGTRANFDVMFKTKPLDKWVFSVGPGLTVMDSQYAQTYYGVSAAQSASSGYTAYQASAGLNTLRLGAGADYELTRNWHLGARVSVSKLQGDAANSPTIEKSTQSSYGLFANYRF